MKKLLSFCIIGLISTNLFSQSIETVSSKYDRNSLSVHFFTDKNFDILNSFNGYLQAGKTIVPNKFDDNSIKDYFIPVSSKVDYLNAGLFSSPFYDALSTQEKLGVDSIVIALQEIKLPNKILKKVLMGDGNVFNMELLEQRARYSASDKDVLSAKNTKRGMQSILNKSGDFIDNIYFLVKKITKFEIEDVKDSESNENRFKVYYDSYLFKIELDKNSFWEEFYFNETDNSKFNKFMNNAFKVKFISKKYSIASTSDTETKITFEGLKAVKRYEKKKDEVIAEELLTSMMSNSILEHSRKYEPFQIKTPIYATNPIRAKIGTKEDLDVDDLFAVYRNEFDEKTNQKVSIRTTYLRTKKVVDNQKDADGNTEPSLFYRVNAGKVEKNYFLKEVPETGILVGMNVDIPLTSYPLFKGPMLQLDYITKWARGLRIGAAIGVTPESKSKYLYGVNNGQITGRTTYFELSIQKVLQAGLVEITPMITGGLADMSVESATYSILERSGNFYFNRFYSLNKSQIKSALGEDVSYSAIPVTLGIKLGFNLSKYFQINGGFKYGSNLAGSLETEKGNQVTIDGNVIDADFSVPLSFTIGVRLFGF